MNALRATVILGFALAIPISHSVGGETDEPSGVAVKYSVRSGYFEKNNAGLKGDTSYLSISDRKAFDRIFGVGFTAGKKPDVLPDDAFESTMVVAVIKRGGETWTYDVESVKVQDSTLTVRYRATGKDGGGAKFASPLIVSVSRATYRSVVFIENGKEVGKANAVSD